MNPITLKVDNRYKDGNVVYKNGMFRGNQETMRLHRPKVEPLLKDLNHHVDMYNDHLKLQLNPPIIVSRELATHLEGNM